jgi:hypothetical protein
LLRERSQAWRCAANFMQARTYRSSVCGVGCRNEVVGVRVGYAQPADVVPLHSGDGAGFAAGAEIAAGGEVVRG